MVSTSHTVASPRRMSFTEIRRGRHGLGREGQAGHGEGCRRGAGRRGGRLKAHSYAEHLPRAISPEPAEYPMALEVRIRKLEEI
jgi:hypothetical protein